MPARYEEISVTHDFLNNNPSAFVVFGDDLQQRSTDAAAALRGHPRAVGFAVKKAPTDQKDSIFKAEEYGRVFFGLLKQLKNHIVKNPNWVFYIPKLVSEKANKYRIWELIIEHNLTSELEEYNNVVFCWKKPETLE